MDDDRRELSVKCGVDDYRFVLLSSPLNIYVDRLSAKKAVDSLTTRHPPAAVD